MIPGYEWWWICWKKQRYCLKLKKGKTKVGFDRSGQALFCVRLKEVVVAAVVQHGVDTCQDERMTDVLKVGEK
jgi:hypothetical protein